MNRKFAIAALCIAGCIALSACDMSIPEATPSLVTPSEIPTPMPTVSPTPTPTKEANVSAQLVIAASVENDLPTAEQTVIGTEEDGFYVYATIAGVAEEKEFFVELTEASGLQSQGMPKRLKENGSFLTRFEPETPEFEPGKYTATLWESDKETPLATAELEIVLTPDVIRGKAYVPTQLTRFQCVWIENGKQDPGNYLTARLDGRPFENYLVSRVYEQDPKDILDYFEKEDGIYMQRSSWQAPLLYLPKQMKAGYTWSDLVGGIEETLTVEEVGFEFEVQGKKYPRCSRLRVELAYGDGQKGTEYQIYAPGFGMIYAWQAGEDAAAAQASPEFYLDASESIALEAALPAFETAIKSKSE